MRRLQVESFGPLRQADVTFGDLTVLVGPQASGKSLFVQLLKAVKDPGFIRADLESYGYDWLHGEVPIRDYCSIYFGEGMGDVIGPGTSLRRDGKLIDVGRLVRARGRPLADETTYLIPAQRVVALQDGWPRPFMGYSMGDPYCMRRFGDGLRLLMERGFPGGVMFPEGRRLKGELRERIDRDIYIGARLKLEIQGMRKRLVLVPHEGAPSIPYSAWSAGQREFTPLLLGLYWLLPPEKAQRKGHVDTVIIEEPEMGLHPQAIVGFGLLVLELLHRGYRVILSAHVPIVLDLVWAIRELKMVPRERAIKALKRIFGLSGGSQQIQAILDSALRKDYKTYFFERADGNEREVHTRDISTLDPGDEDKIISGWGGLSGFSGQIAQIVGEAITEGHAR